MEEFEEFEEFEELEEFDEFDELVELDISGGAPDPDRPPPGVTS